jgi:hypothetical protein
MISPEDAKKLVIGHSAGNLTREERTALYRAAFEDQETFDRLMEEEAVRQALEYPGQRERLLAGIEEARPSLFERLTGWLRQPAALSLAGSLAAGLMIGVFLARQQQPQYPGNVYTEKAVNVPGATEKETALAAGAFSLPLQSNIPVKLSMDRKQYSPGDPIHLTFQVGADAYVLVFDLKADRDAMLLYPAGGTSKIVKAGETITLPEDPSARLAAEGPPGVHGIRMVALPPAADPLTSPPDWKAEDGHVGVAEVRYQVSQ